jgi:hypothetical protein
MTDIEQVVDETLQQSGQTGLLPFESWEKLPGESGLAYAAFCAYRDYGPERNIRRAVEKACAENEEPEENGGGGKKSAAKKYQSWRLWSMRFQWVKRAADYDRYLEKLKQTELRRAIEARGEAHRKVTDKMLQVVSKKLDLMEPGELTQGAVVEWVEAAINTERVILGAAVPVDGGKKHNANSGQLEIQFTQEFEGL